MCGPCGTSDICQKCINNPNKEEFMFEEEAEKYVAEKADKGNFDVEKFGKAYFSESAMRLAFKAGADFGFKECAKSRLNITTISDRPAEGIIEELQAQIEKMKCCTNCRYCIKEWGEFNSNSPNCKKCHNQSNWKLRR